MYVKPSHVIMTKLIRSILIVQLFNLQLSSFRLSLSLAGYFENYIIRFSYVSNIWRRSDSIQHYTNLGMLPALPFVSWHRASHWPVIFIVASLDLATSAIFSVGPFLVRNIFSLNHCYPFNGGEVFFLKTFPDIYNIKNIVLRNYLQ